MSVNSSLSKKTFGGFLWMLGGQGMQGISQFLVLIVLARLIKPEEFGIVSAAMIIIGFSIIFSSLGVGPALVQREKLSNEHINTAFVMSIILGIIFSLIIFLLSGLVSGFFRIPELRQVLHWLSLIFIIQGFYVTPLSILERDMHYKKISLINSAAYILGYGAFGISTALIGLGVYSLVFAQLSQEIIKLILISLFAKRKYKLTFTLNSFKDLMYFGSGFTLARIFNYAALQGDNLIVGRYLGAASLGLYGRVYQLMAFPATLFGQVVDKVLFSAMSKIQTDFRKMGDAYNKGVALIALVAIPLSVFCFLFAKEIIIVLLGEDWSKAIVPFQLFSIGLFFRVGYKISESIARATGAVYRRAWRQFVYAFLVIIGSFIGKKWGIEGVIIGVNVALFSNFILMTGLSLEILKMKVIDFIFIHIPFILNALISFSILIFIDIDFSNHLFTLIVNLAILVILNIGISFINPKIFLGVHGISIVKILSKYFFKRL
ncbi:lipopolysaccharide biosynthesis protein [Priestia megaterium]|nr:lipopolysaccharide biosynthesis protein [Priestia megaterium]